MPSKQQRAAQQRRTLKPLDPTTDESVDDPTDDGFAAAVRAAEQLHAAVESTSEPHDYATPDDTAAYEWPTFRAEQPTDDAEFSAALDYILTLRHTVHTQVYADVYTLLLSHNGIEDPGAVEFAVRWAQYTADVAAAQYQPYQPDDDGDDEQ